MESQTQPVSSCDIHQLADHASPSSGNKAYIFAVPGVSTLPPPEAWKCNDQKPWLESAAERLAEDGWGCTVLALRHHLPSAPTDWTEVLHRGVEFLRTLEHYFASKKIGDFSLLIVCHSIGGLIVKQALLSAFRSGGAHDIILRALRGIVFISSPHLHSEQNVDTQRVLGVLLSETRHASKRLTSTSEWQSLLSLCNGFGDIHLSVPVLSTYETKATKLKNTISPAGQPVGKYVLVGKDLASVGLYREELIPIEAEHGSTCLVGEGSSLAQKLIGFVSQCLGPSIQASPGPSSLLPTQPRDYSSTLVLRPAAADATSAESPRLPSVPLISSSHAHSKSDTKPAGPRLPCSTIDMSKSSEKFLWRDDVLAKMDSALAVESDIQPDRVQYVALHGIGGIGKTHTAFRYATTRKDRYHARFWIRADTQDKIMDSFTQIAILLGLLNPLEAQDRAFNRQTVMDWFRHPVMDFHSKDNTNLARWLIVFDNVEDIDVLEDFCPGEGGGSIIVTSRNPLTKWRPQGVERRNNEGIKMSPFGVKEATDFLKMIAPDADKKRDPGAAAELAVRLDCIPFALRQMGEYIHRKQTTFQRFLTLYKDDHNHGAIHKARVRRASEGEYDFSISTVWAVEQLTETTRSLMAVLALLDPDAIKEYILMPGDESVVDELYPSNIAEYEDAIAELSSSSLITTDNDKEELSLHRTVQDAVRAKMTPEQFHATFETAVALLLRHWPVKGRMWHYPVDRWPHCEVLSSHLIKVHSHYRSNSSAKDRPAPSSSFAQLLVYGGWYWYQRGAPDQAKAFFDTAEQLSAQLPDGIELLTDIWMCQGNVATETNDPVSCKKYYERLLKATLENIPNPKTADEHERYASAYNERGIAHMMSKRVEKALDHFEKAKWHSAGYLKASETIYSMWMFACANLGLAQWLSERYEEALRVLMEAYSAFENRKNIGGEDSFIPGRLMHAIGNVKVSQGEHQLGFSWHYAAFEHYQKTIGKGHHRTADVRHKLAEGYLRQGQLPEARKSIERALKVFDSKRCYVPEKMRTTYLLGRVCEAEGKQEEAEKCYAAAESLYKKLKQERGEDLPSKDLSMADYDAIVTFWSR